MIDSLNQFLDALPRTRLRRGGREVHAFRACGLSGFYCALIVTLGGGLIAGRSLLILTGVALVCVLSFFVFAYLRRWLTGLENLVQTEHVWFALACAALSLWLSGEPVLPYLDVLVIGLCFFMAGGRVGCLLVGCCHGLPSKIGITYDERCATDGFTSEFVGVRLFPLPAIEMAGLIIIGTVGLFALPFALPGAVLVWFLIAHAVLRFSFEGLRGDARPSLLGLSRTRWMSLLQFTFALQLNEKERPFQWVIFALAFLLLIATLIVYRRRDWRHRLLDKEHLREIVELVRREVETGFNSLASVPVLQTTSQRLAVAISQAGLSLPSTIHVSLSLPHDAQDLPRLCELAARAFPETIPETARCNNESVLHIAVPVPLADVETKLPDRQHLARALYGTALRRLQNKDKVRAKESSAIEEQSIPDVEQSFTIKEQSSVDEAPSPIVAEQLPPLAVTTPSETSTQKRWYFASEHAGNPRS